MDATTPRSSGIALDIRWACFTSIILAATYLLTAAPQVTLIDSGELAVAARALGNPHSPGYPGYTTLAHAVLLLVPWGNDAWRLAVLSGFGGAIACALTMLLVTWSTRSRLIGVFSGLSFGWSLNLWQQSCMVEVYPLALCFGAVMALLVFWPRLSIAEHLPLSIQQRMGAFGLTFGIGLGFHHFTVFYLPGLGIAAFLLHGLRVLKPRHLALAACGFLLGFSHHAHLPIRAAIGPYYAWENPSTWHQFHRVVTTKNFHNQRFVRSWEMFEGYFGNFQDALTEQFALPVLALAVAGLLLGTRRLSPLVVGLVPLWLITSTLGTIYFNLPPSFYDTLKVFYLPAHWVLSVFAGLGLHGLITRLPAKPWRTPATAVIVVALLSWTLALNAPQSNRSNEWYVFDWGRALLFNTPPDGTLVFQSDEGFVLWYLQGSLNMRPDVALVFADILTTPGIRQTSAAWFFEQTARNYPWLHLPEEGPPPFRAMQLAQQRPLTLSFHHVGFRPPGWDMRPRFPGFELVPADQPFSPQAYAEDIRDFPLRNPPTHLGARMTADRDYLDATLYSLSRARMRSPEDAPGSAEITAYLDELDHRFYRIYMRRIRSVGP